MMRVVLVASLLALLAARAHGDGEACKPRPPQVRYNIKTGYGLVADHDVKPVERLQDCEAVYVWHLLRHGTRYPAEVVAFRDHVGRVQAGMRANVQAGRVDRECMPAVEQMLSWKLNSTEQQASQLTPQAHLDMMGIGSRFRERYPNFFEKNPPEAFEFMSSAKQRCKDSYQWYAHGAFPDAADLPPPKRDDFRIKFYDTCPAWRDGVEKNISAYAQEHKFRDGEHMKMAIQRISTRLGFPEPLPYADVEAIWDACRYDQSWFPDVESPWCAAFDEEDLIVIEYSQDLKYYYTLSYGSDISVKLGCTPVKDVIKQFSDFQTGNSSTKGNMYFTQSKALQLTFASLKIGWHPEPLTADSFNEHAIHRGWRTTMLMPFSANLAFVLYQCPVGEKYKVRMYINEHPAPVWGCHDMDALCSWNDFVKEFGSVADSCSLDFCHKHSQNQGQTQEQAEEGPRKTVANKEKS